MLPLRQTPVRWSYRRRVQVVRPGNLVFYLPMLDKAASGTALDYSGNGRNGTPKSATAPTMGASGIGDGQTATLFNSAEYINLLTAAGGQFNGAEGAVSLWYKTDATILNDAAAHYLFYANVDGNNAVYVRKQTTANQYIASHAGGGTGKVAAWTSSSTAWNHLLWTWSATKGKAELWLNGEPGANPSAGLGTFVGALTTFLLGATTTGGASSYKGGMAHVGLWNVGLNAGDAALLGRKRGCVTFYGDSRTQGTTSPFPNQCMALAGTQARNLGWVNKGVSGRTVLDLYNNRLTDIVPHFHFGMKNVAVVWAGVNDGAAGVDAATIWARIQTLCTALRAAGLKVILCTEIDSQSVQSNAAGWHGTIWPALNTLVRAGWASVADYLVDLGAITQLQDATNATYFTDLTHLTDAGYGLVATAVSNVLVTI